MNLRDYIDQARAGEVEEPEGPLTAGRQKRRAAYRDYYHANPEQTLKDQARQSKYQETSAETADRHGDQWTAGDLATAIRLQQPIMVSAQQAERTYAAIRQARYRLIRQSGFRNTLLKEETDEYDALIRREDFTVDELIEHDAKWRDVFLRTMPTDPDAGHKPIRRHQYWTPWEDEMLRDYTHTAEQLALKLGRTAKAVGRRRCRLKDIAK